MKKIKLTQGKVALVDDGDFEKVSQYKWAACRQYSGAFYAGTVRNKKLIGMHRLVLNFYGKNLCVDHINGDPLDNRKVNLRICTQAENRRNSKINKRNISGYKGVSFIKMSGKYQSRICFNYKQYELGTFERAEDAAFAYNKKAKELFGEFARLNIIPEANNE